MQASTVLITGGTGLIGRHLIPLLEERGYRVILLGRKRNLTASPPIYGWDYKTGTMDEEAMSPAHFVIHLAGAGIGDKRWTPSRKKEIVESRVKTTMLLYDSFRRLNPPLKAFISSSATGYYGSTPGDPPSTEQDLPGTDFLAETCKKWEESVLPFEQAGIRNVIIRTGIVLSSKGGALAKMIQPFRFGLGSLLGNGKQYLPWIHIDDLCAVYLKALQEASMHGAYNAVAPEYTTNKDFTRSLATVLGKPLWLPAIPGLLMKLLFGKMAVIILEGKRVHPARLLDASFTYQYPSLKVALQNLLRDEEATSQHGDF